MLDKLKQIAITLRWFKSIALLLMLTSLVIVGYVLIGKSGIAADDFYLIPSILTALWSFSVFWSLHTFPSIPVNPINQSVYLHAYSFTLNDFPITLLLLLLLAYR